MIYAAPGATIYPELDGAPTGLVGTIGVRVLRNSDDSTVAARTTSGIREVPAGSGHYVVTLSAPTTAGDYSVFWDTGTVTPTTTASEELSVTSTLPAPAAPGATQLQAAVDRVLVGTAATIQITFTVAGTPTDATGDVLLTVARDSGDVLVNGVTATHVETGVYQYALTPTDTGLLDRLTASWTGTIGGVAQTLTTAIEVVGGFLFSVPEAKARPGLETVADADIQAIRTRVEQAIEDACGMAFVPRYDRATLNGDGTMLLRLGRPLLRRVRWASTVISGVTTTLVPADLSALSVSAAGFVAGYRWPTGYGSAVVGYEHGMDRPPEPVRSAALDYARFLLTQDTSIDSRADRLVTDDGTLVFAGNGGTGLPAVDRVIEGYRIPSVA